MKAPHSAREPIGQNDALTCPDYTWAEAGRMLTAALKAQVSKGIVLPDDSPDRTGQDQWPFCPPPPQPIGAGAGQYRAGSR